MNHIEITFTPKQLKLLKPILDTVEDIQGKYKTYIIIGQILIPDDIKNIPEPIGKFGIVISPTAEQIVNKIPPKKWIKLIQESEAGK